MMRSSFGVVTCMLVVACGGSADGGAAEPLDFGPEPKGGNSVEFLDGTSPVVFGQDEPAPTSSPGQLAPQELESGDSIIGGCAEFAEDACELCSCLGRGSAACDVVCDEAEGDPPEAS